MEGLPLDLLQRFGCRDPRWRSVRVDVQRQGNFTLALLYDDASGVRSFGIAKRNVSDEERPEHAARLAIARALRRLTA